MNVGIALVGIVGGLVVGVGLAVQARRDRALDELLRRDGVACQATVVAVVATGRHLAFRRVTFATEHGSEFLQTFPFVEAGQLGLADGAQVEVRVLRDPATGAVRGRLVQPMPTGRVEAVPIAIGVFIAVLGVAAALVV